jgi:hypothetical protein
MLEFILLFLFFFWFFNRKQKRNKGKLFKPSIDQELKESKLETLLEIKYSDVFNAVQILGQGDVAKVRKLFLDFQKNLYLPHTEYQRVS